MEEKLKTVKKAKGIAVQSVWLALNKDESFDKRLSITDLFVKTNPDNTYKKANPIDVWSILAEHGIFIHPVLMEQYAKQCTCIWDGGLITRIAVNTTNWEDRCSLCGFRYKEG